MYIIDNELVLINFIRGDYFFRLKSASFSFGQNDINLLVEF